MSLFRQLGLSIAVSEPRWLTTSFQADLTDEVRTYYHERRALGGYWSASFTLPSAYGYIDDRWLGRDITVRDDALNIIWQGFVNMLQINQGPLMLTLGPLLHIGNRVAVVYSTIDTSTTPPTVGVRVITDYADNTDSQALHGIRYKVLSTGGATPVTAVQIRDTYLAEYAYPKNSKTWPQGVGVGVTVECLGYVHLLDWPYTETTSGTSDADDKLLDILADDPNLTWDTSHVDANTLQVKTWENDSKSAWTVLQDIINRGDATDARWLFNVRENLEAWYYAAPTTVDYEQSLSDTVVRQQGATVFPWNVEPGRWFLVPDLDVGRSLVVNLYTDLRAAFLESVTYTAPWGLTWQGSRLETLPQVLAQLGLAGVGA